MNKYVNRKVHMYMYINHIIPALLGFVYPHLFVSQILKFSPLTAVASSRLQVCQVHRAFAGGKALARCCGVAGVRVQNLPFDKGKMTIEHWSNC